jgi:HAD superfamily phosphoserine phosphatase-like hydrolase
MLLPAAEAVVRQRLAAGDLVAVVTATTSFVTRPIAQMYGIEHLVATEPEMTNGRFTGRVTGVPCFQAGKVTCVQAWLGGRTQRLTDFSESWFYTDSHNDLRCFTLSPAGSRSTPTLSWPSKPRYRVGRS